MTAPTAEEMEAYRRGTLPLARFQAIDAWLETRPAEEQVRLLAETPAAVGTPVPLPSPAATAFASEGDRARYRLGAELGRGGMGVVWALTDTRLGRDLALKTCRPRAPEEPVERHAARLRAFRREAAITARLEHPAVVPVHDVGLGPHGEPAYVMKRLEGRPLTEAVDRVRAGGRPDLADAVETVLRVAEATAYAHARGIVHRDLKPDNVVVGALGAVSIIDWGLAGLTADGAHDGATPGGNAEGADRGGGCPSGQPSPAGAAGTPPRAGADAQRTQGFTASGAGTPRWMAPEQDGGANADPRMDVWALGGLLLALLTGDEPRDGGGRPTALDRLEERGVPRGLAAVIRTCLAPEPARRYADAGAVAAELRGWLAAGITAAERPSALRRAWRALRRSPRVTAAGAVLLGAATAWIATAAIDGHRRDDRIRRRLAVLERTTALADLPALRTAHGEAEEHLRESGLPEARALAARFGAALEAAAAREALAQAGARLAALEARWRAHGPWSGEVADAATAVASFGVHLADPASDLAALAGHPLRDRVLGVLVRLQRTLITTRSADPRGSRILAVLAGSGGGWAALADLLARPELRAHDLVFCPCPESGIALADPATADLLFEIYAPDERLTRHADERLAAEPGAFWPRVVAARGAYADGDWERARRHALVALGADPGSLWPHLLLAYATLRLGDDTGLARAAQDGLRANPDHLELRLLAAVAAARRGDRSAGEALVAERAIAAHFRYHREHRHGHPMEDAVDALVDAGIAIPAVDARIGPLVPEAAP